MSSIMRRRRGLNSTIGGAPVLTIGLRQPQSSQTGHLPQTAHITPALAGSFNRVTALSNIDRIVAAAKDDSPVAAKDVKGIIARADMDRELAIPGRNTVTPAAGDDGRATV